ncbi:MAG TPA: DNA repair protein RadC [Gammaproteobacteria bacterium]|jgi:DNA repair protein RadC|nr:DNA repair protein RadC [Gammaproteobacteria bacterium]MBT3717429.1 DNA repair protein RadC [Gammaproteobacteria bacterium]MBT3844208.1 DNA repair protein RadC [Gammaproteobacteria bacterium]MBT4301893.1 DNA repair protein RadC [Gammaproteobacteria bacterium]MBT4548259.1 DNA repair protein RadC [Gammaproteobacteria bacterium]
MAITDWPEGERPREKLLQRGAQSLSDAELLAIFLRTGLPGKSAVDLARELLERFGGLRQLLEADHSTFCSAKGLGDAKYAQLQATLEMSCRHLKAQLSKGDVLTSPQLTRSYLSSRLRGYPQEVFAALYLDNQHRVITFETLFTGTIDGASVHPREVVRSALQHNAAALIFAHNHPSGVAEPSASDRSITQTLKEALSLVDIRVLDHIIIGDGESTTSFAERGIL